MLRNLDFLPDAEFLPDSVVFHDFLGGYAGIPLGNFVEGIAALDGIRRVGSARRGAGRLG